MRNTSAIVGKQKEKTVNIWLLGIALVVLLTMLAFTHGQMAGNAGRDRGKFIDFARVNKIRDDTVEWVA